MLAGNTADDKGGGVSLYNGGTLKNCTLRGNTADDAGGAVLYNGGTLNSSTLSGNTAANDGGGAYLNAGGTVNNCALSGNTATKYNGGGAYFTGSGGNLNNCMLSGNTAASGGGAYFYPSLYAGVTNKSKLQNCMLSGNTATNNGGGVFFQGRGIMTNCTVAGNTATNNGGGVYFQSGSMGTAMVHNCVIWGNTHVSSSNVYRSGSTAIVSYTCSGPAQLGTGNIEFDPRFVDANGGNYRLMVNSPCVNTGENSGWMTNSYDLDGRIRIRYITVDMGAYEWISAGTIYGVQ